MRITRYPNRKMYSNGAYFTNRRLLQLVLSDQDFTVIDHRTKNDLTHNALASVLAGRLNTLDKQTLIELIKRI